MTQAKTRIAKARLRGRKRRIGVGREANGRIARGDLAVIPAAALDRRAESLGLDPERFRSMVEAVARICGDEQAGTALGRLTWQYHLDGQRTRRMGLFDGVEAPWITDAMAAAAEDYRALWVHWHRLSGLPRRHPQSQQFERQPRGVDPGPDPRCQAGPDNRACECNACRTLRRLKRAEAALLACHPTRLVLTAIDMVVIENLAPDSLVLGERSAALHALRQGLAALARFFRHG